MATAVWTGSISFGLVSIPVKLFPATASQTIRFNQIDTRTGARVRQQRISAADGSEVPREAIAKGYEMPDGQYVIIEDADLAAINPKKSATMEIEQFVELSEIDPIIYDRAYNVVPDSSVVKPYALLLDAMEGSNRVAIARFVMHTKEHLCALRPDAGRLVLSTMLFADELRDTTEHSSLDAVRDVEVTARERKMASQLIESLTEPFEHTAFHDEHRQRVQELIDARATGATEVVEGESGAPAEAEVVDLMAALEASVRDAKAARKRHPTARPATKATTATVKKAARKRAPAKKAARAKKAS